LHVQSPRGRELDSKLRRYSKLGGRRNYKSAWRMKHKIMQVMAERESTRKLAGFVQIDDAYLGGERNGCKAGRGSENKQSFLIAVQTDDTFTAP
ncbi:transposase, partial [Xanthomonas campestris pv. campestris]|nr:transposase [Xanthomonas campestris pv. campestris]